MTGSEHGRPASRQVSTWADAEQAAADWMRYWGFDDAVVTRTGPDGGIDVEASAAVAQVKFTAHAVGGPAVQQLFGARGPDTDKALLFFTGTSYSAQATAYAERVGMALFTYDLLGQPTPVNAAARILMKVAERTRNVPAAASASMSSSPPSGGAGRSAPATAARAWATWTPTSTFGSALAASALWMLPATLLLVGLAAVLARGGLSVYIVLVTLIGLWAYVRATAAARRALANVATPGRRFAGAALMVVPGLIIWLPVTQHTYLDAEHSAGEGVWVVFLLLLVVGPLLAAQRQG